jgi:hypothetical protein
MDREARRRRRRGQKFLQHVRLHHWVLDTEAYRSLPAEARSLLVELMRIYNGSNNGRIALGVREAGELCLCSKNTAARAFQQLEDRGFIRCQTTSSFTYKVRRAKEWCLTEFRNDVEGQAPTKEFTRWRQQKNTVPDLPNHSPQ